MTKVKHNCDNINCNHNDTKGLCCLFNPDNCKYRQLQKENAELKKVCDETQELLDKQIEATYKLDKENAELKGLVNQYKASKCSGISLVNRNMIMSEQLTKAKGIIKIMKHLLFDVWGYIDIPFEKKVNDFLSEVKK